MYRLSLLVFLPCLACANGAKPAWHVSGRATSPSTGARAATVRAYRVARDGSIYEASRRDVSTDRAGAYRIAVDGRSTGALVVVANFDDGSVGAVLVGGAASAGDGVTAAPMGAETTAEADLYERIGARGSGGDASGALLRAFVDERLATDWEVAGDEHRAALARSTSAALSAWEAAGGATSRPATRALALATAEADQAVDAGAAPPDPREMLASAWTNAGASVDDLAYMSAAAWNAQAAVASGDPIEDGEARILGDLHGAFAGDVIANATAELAASRGGALPADTAVGARVDDPEAVASTVDDLLSPEQSSAFAGQAIVAGKEAGRMKARVETASPSEAGEASASAIEDYRYAVEEVTAHRLQASGAFSRDDAKAAAMVLAQAYAVEK